MNIQELSLHTRHVADQKAFYCTTLGLSLLTETTDSFTVQAGRTRLRFQESEPDVPSYHVAFTIPCQTFHEAKSWVQKRLPLLHKNGEDEIFFANLNARSFYFCDPAGNILEYIVHHLYWLLGTSVQEKTDLACPITLIPGHGTRLRDTGNLFFSLSERGKLHQARTTDTFWQHALRKTIWMPSERSSFEGIWTNDDGTLAQLDPLMHGRLRWILFKPPFGSHGAVRPRSE